MKAQRRHELQANELARQLETFPETLKRNASTIMLVIAVVLVVFFLVRYRKQAAENRSNVLASSLEMARSGPLRLRTLTWYGLPPDRLAAERGVLVSQTQSAIDSVLREADGSGDDEAAMRASALVSRGDLNWYLANTPPVPGAATQPNLALPKQPDEYLRLAESDYRDVVNGYSKQIVAWVSAQLGLAAIAENRSEWDKARKIYAEVVARADVPNVFQYQAQRRMTLLKDVQSPVLIGEFNPASSMPTTVPAVPSFLKVPSTEPEPATQANP